MNAQIEPYLPGDAFVESFAEVAVRVYKNDPYWLPENVQDLRRLFASDNPFFEHAAGQFWLVPGKARVAGFFDPAVRVHGRPSAYFGYWEGINDETIHRNLFNEVENWARQQGAEALYGPINFNTFGNYRIKTNFMPGEGCFIGEPYNPDYYQNLLTQCGLKPDTLYFSQILNADSIKRLYVLKSPMLAGLRRLPLRIELLTESLWMGRLKELYGLVDSIFAQNFAYSPIPEESFLRQYGQPFANRICPHTSTVILDPQDRIVAFCAGFPDFAPLCRRGTREPLSISEVNVRDHFNLLTDPVLLVKTAGVHPDYRNQGLLNAMALMVLERGRTIYSNAIMCLIREGNFSAEFCKEVPSHLRTYALFSKILR